MRLETERLILRPWRDEDRPAFHRLNSDETVMKFFPFRRSRAEADQVLDKLNRLIAENGFSFSALQRKEDGALIGICGLHRGGLAPLFPEETVEIGWRLLPDYWGKGYVSEAARACLAHGFEAQGLDEIVAFAVHDNYRSLAVMERIGMRHAAQRDFEHPGIDDRFSHLRPHRTYAISRRDWLAAQA